MEHGSHSIHIATLRYQLFTTACDNIAPFSIFISIIPIRSALLRCLGSALPINIFLLGSAARI
jgi:hypothetical protein